MGVDIITLQSLPITSIKFSLYFFPSQSTPFWGGQYQHPYGVCHTTKKHTRKRTNELVSVIIIFPSVMVVISYWLSQVPAQYKDASISVCKKCHLTNVKCQQDTTIEATLPSAFFIKLPQYSIHSRTCKFPKRTQSEYLQASLWGPFMGKITVHVFIAYKRLPYVITEDENTAITGINLSFFFFLTFI